MECVTSLEQQPIHLAVDRHKIGLKPDLILDRWKNAWGSRGSKVNHNNTWKQDWFPAPAQGQEFTEVYIHLERICFFLIALYHISFKTPWTWSPGRIHNEHNDKPQLSLTTKYGLGYIKGTLSSPHPPHLQLFRQVAVNVSP